MGARPLALGHLLAPSAATTTQGGSQKTLATRPGARSSGYGDPTLQRRHLARSRRSAVPPGASERALRHLVLGRAHRVSDCDLLQETLRTRVDMLRTADPCRTPPRCSAILVSLCLDTTFYGTPTLTPLRFLHTNVFQSISLFYGANAWHFYLSQGVPILLATQLPFFLDGVYSFSGSRRLAVAIQNERAVSALVVTLGTTLGAYSFLSHKEWRFIHPLLPIMHLFVAYSLVRRQGTTFPQTPRRRVSLQSRLAQVLRVRPSHALVMAFSLLPALYLTAFHGLAQNTVMSHLRTELERDSRTTLAAGRSRTSTLGFLMPCHSTGWQAFLHRPEMEEEGGAAGAFDKENETLWMLTCEPPILYVFALRLPCPVSVISILTVPLSLARSGQDPATYRDESDIFYSDPCGYITSQLLPPASSSSSPEPSTSTSRLVLFSNLLEQPCLDPIKTRAATVGELLLLQSRYVNEWEGWNTLGGWHEDERRKGTVVVLRRGGDDDQR